MSVLGLGHYGGSLIEEDQPLSDKVKLVDCIYKSNQRVKTLHFLVLTPPSRKKILLVTLSPVDFKNLLSEIYCLCSGLYKIDNNNNSNH